MSLSLRVCCVCVLLAQVCWQVCVMCLLSFDVSSGICEKSGAYGQCSVSYELRAKTKILMFMSFVFFE